MPDAAGHPQPNALELAAAENLRTLLTPIPQRTAGERIAERIVTAVALGEFVPGQRLPAERELATMLEVSRATVREALQRLQAAGYVHTRRRLWVVVPVIGVVVLAVPVWGDLRPGQASPYNILPWLTIGLIALGVIYALVLGWLRPDTLRRAPALLEGAESADPEPAASG